MTQTRHAIVSGGTPQKVAAYLPECYRVTGTAPDGAVSISGTDTLGWTLHDYVIPRLASGGMIVHEEAQ